MANVRSNDYKTPSCYHFNLQKPAMTTVIETCRIPPPQGVAAELFLPLSFFDISWLHLNPIRSLVFYNHPCSEAEFHNTIVPNLKHTLSLTLKHYLPVAANLLYPLHTDTSKPVFRYTSGYSVPLTIAVSGFDFDELVADHARESDPFYALVPPAPPLLDEENYKIVPLIALQATLFPGRGISIGMNYHHSLCDGRSIFGFFNSWAVINKSGSDEVFISRNTESLPVFARPVSEASRRIDGIFWNVMKKIPFQPARSHPMPTNRVRASFILRKSHIKSLKIMISQSLLISTFAVASAYIWTSLAKCGGGGGDEDEVFYYPADGRGRRNALFDPPVPANYFGNCLGAGVVRLERRKLAAEDGFVVAAKAIDDEMNKIYDGDEFLKKPENRLPIVLSNFKDVRMLLASGSPRFEFAEADFGWGSTRKVEFLSMDDRTYAMWLGSSGDGLVVGMSLPREMMEAFASIFQDGLRVGAKVYGKARI